MIKYSIKIFPKAHKLRIELTYDVKENRSNRVSLPVWIPGSYKVRDFSSVLTMLDKVKFLSKNTWEVNTEAPRAVLNYEVLLDKFSDVRESYLDSEGANLNLAGLCLQVIGREKEEHTVEFLNLEDLSWEIFGQLDQLRAKSYSELIDSPLFLIPLGSSKKLSFLAAGKNHHLIIKGLLPQGFKEEKLTEDIKKICEQVAKICQSQIPDSKEYHFLLQTQAFSTDLFTGLEHRNSSFLVAPYLSLFSGSGKPYLNLLRLFAHEYLHLWLIKRIRPAILREYDLNRENYTSLLWWFEGVVSFYEITLLYRAGICTTEDFLEDILIRYNTIYKYPGHKLQSLAESSRETWCKFYQLGEQKLPNLGISYYVQGSLVGLLLDWHLKVKYNLKEGIDKVLQLMVQSGKQNLAWEDVFIPEGGIYDLVEQLTGNSLLSQQLQSWVENRSADMSWSEVFATLGLKLYKVRDGSYTPFSSKSALENKFLISANKLLSLQQTNAVKLDCSLEKRALGYEVRFVPQESLSEKAGLQGGDLIIALDGVEFYDEKQQLATYSFGQKAVLTVLRYRELKTIQFSFALSESYSYYGVLEEKSSLNAYFA